MTTALHCLFVVQIIVFATLYYNTFAKSQHKKVAIPLTKTADDEEAAPLKSSPAPVGSS